jgi:hypothetical protein
MGEGAMKDIGRLRALCGVKGFERDNLGHFLLSSGNGCHQRRRKAQSGWEDQGQTDPREEGHAVCSAFGSSPESPPMFKFSSRKETAPVPDRLVPYGSSRDAKHFQDDIAWYEQERARIDGRSFGRRDTAPERKKLPRCKTPAGRVKHFTPGEGSNTLNRHPGSLFRR